MSREHEDKQQLEPEDALNYRERAAAYNQSGDYALALADLERAIALDASDAAAYVHQGAAYIGLDDPAQAVAAFAQAVALEPKVASHYYNRGLAHFNLAAYSEAAADFARAIELAPPYELAREKLALSRLLLGDTHSDEDHSFSVAAYDQLISREPDNAAAYINRAADHFHLGNYAQAVADTTRAIELNPNSDLAYQNRAAAYSELGRHDLELSDSSRAIELNPTEPVHYLNRAIAYTYYEGGNYEAALSDYRQMLELAPNHPDALYGLACLYALLHEPAESLSQLARAIQHDPDHGSYARDDADFSWLRANNPQFAAAFDQLTGEGGLWQKRYLMLPASRRGRRRAGMRPPLTGRGSLAP